MGFDLAAISADLFAFYFGDINDNGGTSDGSGEPTLGCINPNPYSGELHKLRRRKGAISTICPACVV